MSVTVAGNTIDAISGTAAANDEVTGVLHLASIHLTISGGTAGQLFQITDSAGATIARHVVGGAESVDLLMQPRFSKGWKLAAIPAVGTWRIVTTLG